MRAWRALRAALRVELRHLSRHRGRTSLLAALIAVPVAAITGGATLLRVAEPTTEERQAAVMGSASLLIPLADGHDSLRAVLARLPVTARTARVFRGAEAIRAPGRRLRARLLAAEPEHLGEHGLARGLVRFIEGRPPVHPGEAAISPVLLEGLGAGLGDTVALSFGPLRVVTGVVVDPEQLSAPLVVRTPSIVERPAEAVLLVRMPPPRIAAAESSLRAAGIPFTRREDVGGRDATMTAIVSFFGCVGCFEAALVIASAFTVSLRRRWRELGLIGAVGATTATTAQAMTVSAALLGAAGGVAGVVLGVTAAAAVRPFLDAWTDRWTGAFEVPWSLAAGAALLGVATAIAAVVAPMLQAVRLPLRVALGARRPVKAPARAWLVAGLLLSGLAVALVVARPHLTGAAAGSAVLGAACFGVLGFGALSPWWLAGAARRVDRWPLEWRLAIRDAGRYAARNGPVVTAVLAAMSMGVTVAVLVSSIEKRLDLFPAVLRDDQLLIEGAAAEEAARRISEALPVLAASPLAAVYAQELPVRVRTEGDSAVSAAPDWLAGGDRALLDALAAGAAGPAFARGALLALGGSPDPSRLRVLAGREGRDLGWTDLQHTPMAQAVRGPAYLISRDEAERRGLTLGPPPRRALTPWLVRLTVPVSARHLERALAVAGQVPGTSVDAARLHRAPARGIYRLLLAACMLTGLLVILVSTALTGAESAADEHVLRTVGAPPSVMRRHEAARAAYLALLGCLLAVPAGLLSAAGILGSADVPLDFVMPWRDLFVAVAGLPAFTYALMWWRAGGSFSRVRAAAAVFVFLLASGVPATSQASPPRAEGRAAPAIRWSSHSGRAVDGTPITGDLGRILVPERRALPGGAQIEIAFVRYRSRNPAPGPPVFFLEGGPGGSGVDGCTLIATHPLIRLLESSDVIGIDQRGTGLSRPDLSKPEIPFHLPLDRPLTRREEVAAFATAVARSAALARGRGVDLAAYNTEESADDIDDVRRALGLDRIVLYGASYGSHLGLSVIRRHGRHIERAVLSKVEGPDDTWKLPSTTQQALERAHALAAADPHVRARIPDLMALVRRLTADLERVPVRVRVATSGGDSVRIALGPDDLRGVIAEALATTRGLAGLPRLLAGVADGDWSPLARASLERRRGRVPSMMTIAMDCASGASPARRVRIQRELADRSNLLGDALQAPFVPAVCTACGVPELTAGFRQPFASDVPVLFVSGELDARTPPAQVEVIRAGFTDHAHVRVRGAGHDPREWISEEYRDLLQGFLRGERVQSTELSLPFRFEPFDSR